MPDVTGPSLDQLDAWSTSIDLLDVSLDDSAWTTRTLFEPELSGAVAITGTGVATFTTHAIGSGTAAITATAAAGFVKDVQGTGAVAVTGTAVAQRVVDVSATGELTIVGTGLYGTILVAGSTLFSAIVFAGSAAISVTRSAIVSAAVSVTASSDNEKLGEAWTEITRDDSSADWRDAA